MLPGWLWVDGTEVLNDGRLVANLPCTIGALQLDVHEEPCASLMVDPVTGSPLASGSVTDNPWYHAAHPESERFFGYYVLDSSLDSSSVRSPQARGFARGGSNMGRTLRRQREVAYEIVLVGEDDAALRWGFDWLAQRFDPANGCDTATVLIRTSCDDDDYADGIWELREVGIIDPLEWGDAALRRSGCSIRQATFTIAAGDPWRYSTDSATEFDAVTMPLNDGCAASGEEAVSTQLDFVCPDELPDQTLVAVIPGPGPVGQVDVSVVIDGTVEGAAAMRVRSAPAEAVGYENLDLTAGGQAVTPDPPAVTGDIDIKFTAEVEAVSGSESRVVIARRTSARGWYAALPLLLTGGKLAASFTIGGVSDNAASSAHGLAVGTLAHWWVHRDAATGDVDFYYNVDDLDRLAKELELADWVAIGSDTTIAGAIDDPAGQPPLIGGAYVYDGDEDHGIHIWEGGHTGWKVSDLLAGSGTQMIEDQCAAIDPDLVSFQFGANELDAGQAPATMATHLQTAIDQARAGKPGVPILVHSVWTRGGYDDTTDWQPYVDAMQGVVDANAPAYLLDLRTDFPQPQTPAGNATGYYWDDIHMMDPGHEALAAFFADFFDALPVDLIDAASALANCDDAPFDWIIYGDSTVEGFIASDLTTRWHELLRDELRERWMSEPGGGIGYRSAMYTGDLYAFVTETGTVTGPVGSGLGQRGVTLDAGEAITFPFTGTSVDLIHHASTLGVGERNAVVEVDGTRVAVLEQFQATDEDKVERITLGVSEAHELRVAYADPLVRIGGFYNHTNDYERVVYDAAVYADGALIIDVDFTDPTQFGAGDDEGTDATGNGWSLTGAATFGNPNADDADLDTEFVTCRLYTGERLYIDASGQRVLFDDGSGTWRDGTAKVRTASGVGMFTSVHGDDESWFWVEPANLLGHSDQAEITVSTRTKVGV